MAGNYSVVSQNREVLVLGPTEVIDVEKVGIITKPTGIYVEYPLPLILPYLVKTVRDLNPISRGKQVEMKDVLARRLEVQPVENSLVVADVVERPELRRIEKTARP